MPQTNVAASSAGRTAGAATVTRSRESLRISRDELQIEIRLRPFSLHVRRGGTALGPIGFWAAEGSSGDQLMTITEGVIPREDIGTTEVLGDARLVRATPGEALLAGRMENGCPLELSIEALDSTHLAIELRAADGPERLGAFWPLAPREHLTGLGARHCTTLDQRGRKLQLGADRRYTGPDCPEEMLEVGGIPQGDYAPAPWLLSSRHWALWVETWGAGASFDLGEECTVSTRTAAGPLRLHLFLDPTPAARLRHYCRLTGFAPVLPEWAYGHWKSRDVYEHQRDVLDDFEGYRENQLPLDAIVIDSPWETQYNTWEFNPHQFPEPRAMIGKMRDAGVRTVVWVTPWVNLESNEGQMPPGPESAKLHAEPASNYAEGADVGHFIRAADGQAHVGRWWMGTGSPVDFTSPAADRWWRDLARPVLEMGVEGIKADDGEGYYIPPDARFADGRSGAEAGWDYGRLYRRSMQGALDEVHPGEGVLFGRSGWSGQQSIGMLWAGDQASDFWSLRTMLVSLLTAAASGSSNLSHDVGGYLGHLLMERCPSELLIRWVQLGCFTPLMQAHGRFRQEAWTYDRRTLNIYRTYVLLHERLVPYVRAAAATADRSGLPIMRPLCLTDHTDERGWTVSDSYGYGPSLWVAPVLDTDATERVVELPRGDWIETWSGRRVAGGRAVVAPAPLERIPVWVRAGSIIVSYPSEHVVTGLGDTTEKDRPLEATLWGEPLLGQAGARLADGTRIRWRKGGWSIDADRQISFAIAGG